MYIKFLAIVLSYCLPVILFAQDQDPIPIGKGFVGLNIAWLWLPGLIILAVALMFLPRLFSKGGSGR